MPAIACLRAEPFDVPLTEPFGIATGAQLVAHNVLVTLELSDGSLGLGEAAPFPVVSGETQEQTLGTLETLSSALAGESALRWRRLAASMTEIAPAAPAARAAVEIAVLDAITRRAGLSLWSFFGGADKILETDITITTGDVEHARAAARRAGTAGYSLLKIKVGAASHDEELARLAAIAEAAPNCRWLLDANAGLSADASIALVDALGALKTRVVLFEQPAPAEDLEGLRRVREKARVLVAADESAKSARGVAVLGRERAADVIELEDHEERRRRDPRHAGDCARARARHHDRGHGGNGDCHVHQCLLGRGHRRFLLRGPGHADVHGGPAAGRGLPRCGAPSLRGPNRGRARRVPPIVRQRPALP